MSSLEKKHGGANKIHIKEGDGLLAAFPQQLVLLKKAYCRWALFLFFTTFILPLAEGQVQFKVELLSDHVTYRVSMLPSVTWTPPFNITSTAQVSIKVPTGGFTVGNVTTLVPGTFWANNTQYNSPAEAPGFDYVSFGLTSIGTDNFSYESGVEVYLFTFVNTGVCTGPVEIIRNDDPFFPPNSLNANVTNQLTTAGSGNTSNAFTGAYDAGSANCSIDLDCLAQYQLDQQADGSYVVSMTVDTAWSAPQNVTEELMVTLIAPTGSVDIGSLGSIQAGVAFSHANTYTHLGNDYFVFQLIDTGTSGLSYQRGLVVPLFSFRNDGSCAGDSIALMDNATDPFAMPNVQNARVGQFLRTAGSSMTLEPCTDGQRQPLAPVITNVSTTDLTDCGTDNGTIIIETNNNIPLQYSIDAGLTWQNHPVFTLLPPDLYQVVVGYTGGNCWMDYDQNPVTIAGPQPPVITNISHFNPAGCGTGNGAITITTAGFDAKEYSVDHGLTWQTSNSFSGLPTGAYPVMVRNGNTTCPVVGDIVVLEVADPSNPVIDTVTSSNLTSCSAINGVIRIETQGAPDLEYSINNGATWQPNPNFTGLEKGDYYVLVRDGQSGCASVYEHNPVTINTPDCNRCLAEYELELLSDGRFQVSVTPDTTWGFPQNVTSTAQVTIVVPTGSFEVMGLTNLIPGVVFNDNSIIVAPAENPSYDYISFGLESLGTTNIPYVKGQKVPLFIFDNNVVCNGTEVRLMDNEADPFAFPNSQAINVGQQLTTIGSDQDGLVCVKFPGFAPCAPQVKAVADTIHVFVNTTVVDHILGNDISQTSSPLLASIHPGSMANHGTLNFQPNGMVAYTPDPLFTGIDTLKYVVCEDAVPNTCDIGTVTFIVSAGNDLQAIDDNFQTLVNTALGGTVSPNDLNPDNNGLAFTVGVAPSNGTLSLNGDGTFNYTPDLGFVGFDNFTYKVCDDGFPIACDYAEVQIQVTGSMDLLAIDDSYLGAVGNTIIGDVSINDFNPDGGPLAVSQLAGSDVQSGALTLNNDGTFTYTPNAGFAGIDGFEYVICETIGNLHCDTASVQINIRAAISAFDDSYELDVNTSVSGSVVDNDIYAFGGGVNTVVLQGPSSGSLSFGTDGSFLYTPENGFTGGDQFDYEICNTSQPITCDTATVFLNVLSDIDATDDDFATSIDTPIDGDVLTNDVFANGIDITASLVQTVDDGDLVFDPDGTFSYTPDNGFTGTDGFIYQICGDGIPQTCDTAEVTLAILTSIMAVDDDFEIETGGSLTNNVVGNDLLSNGIDFTVNFITSTNDGVLALSADGAFVYTPNTGFSGIDSFVYQICEDNVPSNCDTATTTISVFEKIEAVDDVFNGNVNTALLGDILTNDVFSNGNFITITVLEQPDDGTLAVGTNGSFNYTPDNNFIGADQFVYSICGVGNIVCDTAVVTLSIEATLLAVDDFVQVPMDMPFNGDVISNDVIDANINPNDLSIGLLLGAGPYNGTVMLVSDGTYTYFPDNGFLGNDSFQYVICNGQLPPVCDTATVRLSVVPSSVWAVNDTFNIFSNNILTGNISDNDLNPSGGVLTVNTTPVTPPNEGSVFLFENGSFLYAPPTDFVGFVSFEYEVCNDLTPQECDIATVFINVYNSALPGIVCTDEVCENENIVLSLGQAYPNSAVFEWQNGNGEVVGTDAALLLPANSPGAVSPFRAQVWENGVSAGFSQPCYVDIIKMPNVHATVSGMACEGDEVQLSATDIAGATYEWRIAGNSTVVSAVQAPVISNVFQNTTYEVTVRLNECGLFGTDTVEVEVASPPALDVQANYFMQANCSPSDLELNANATGNNLSYQWTGPNGFSSTSESPAISNTNAAYNGSYSVTVTNGAGCSSTGSYTMAGIVGFIPEPIITTTTPVCTGDEIELLTQYYSGASVDYDWMHNGTAMIGNSSNQLVLPEVEMTDNGYYQVRVKVDQCTTSSDSFYVEILESPYAGPVVEQADPCSDEPILFFANASNTGGSATYQWTGPNGFTSDAADPVINFPNTEHAGNYTLEVTAENGCTYVRDISVDSSFTQPLPPNLEITDNTPCLGETLELHAEGVYTGQNVKYHWYFNNGLANNAMAVTSSPNFFIPSVTDTHAGVYSVHTVANGCISNVSNLANVTILGTETIAADNSTNANPACEGEDVYLTTTVIAGATYKWFGPGFSSTEAQPVLEEVNMTNAGEYYAVIEKSGCFVYSDTTMVMVTGQPVTPLLLTENEVCESDSMVLSVANPIFNGDVTYEFFSASTGQRIDSTDNSYTTVYNIDLSQTGGYYALTYVDGCPSDASGLANVTVQETPQNNAYAGDDEIHCEILQTIDLMALAPSVGSGTWSSPTGAVIPNFDQAETQANNLLLGENIFVWSLSYGACEDYSMDTVVIAMEELPNETAIAGTDINICNQDTFLLGASATASALGEWSQSPAQAALGVAILQPDDPNSPITGVEPGQAYTFTWSLSAGLCKGFSADEMNVTVVETPAGEAAYILTEANGPSNDTLVLCGDLTAMLEGNSPSIGTGTWTTLGSASIVNPNSPVTGLQGLAHGENLFVWSLSYEACTDYSTDTIIVLNEDLSANDDVFVMAASDTSSIFDIVANDYTEDVTSWEVNLVNPPLKGTVAMNENGEAVYTPFANARGTDEFTYMICSNTCQLICDMATVQLTIVAGTGSDEVFVPNTITPNEDGLNDSFTIPAVLEYPGSELLIFNRWGDEVYFSKDYQNDWGGTFNDNPLPEGTYFYCLVLNDTAKTTTRGFVTVRYE